VRNEAAAEYRDSELSSVETYPPPIFVTARFRSGSTLLWNILRHAPGLTSYYEPLHPTLQKPAAQRLEARDPTHVGVQEYWSEYDRVHDFPAEGYRRPWHNTDLYLDAMDWKPRLAEYLRLLIRSAAGRAALQFNRIDFRLAWLKQMFPAAQIVHLYRHPRDQWLSVLREPTAFGPDAEPIEFLEKDYFFLVEWAHDLSARFPILDWDLVEHPYQMHYLIWKLSYLWGRTYSDISVSYEQLLASPQKTLGDIFSVLGLDQQLVSELTHLIRSNPVGKWHSYAPAEWFTTLEQRAERLLDNFLGAAAAPSLQLLQHKAA
jgi:hypothetical protein